MPRPIEYRSRSRYPADGVYAAMVDPEYILARLAEIGGPKADLLEYSIDAGGARYRLRHGLDAKNLPALVRSVLPGEITIHRAESWTRVDAGGYDGDVDVTIAGTPGSATGAMRLRDAGDGGSELHVRAEVTVKVPLVGGTIEGLVTGYVEDMLAAESAFTQRWLARES